MNLLDRAPLLCLNPPVMDADAVSPTEEQPTSQSRLMALLSRCLTVVLRPWFQNLALFLIALSLYTYPLDTQPPFPFFLKG